MLATRSGHRGCEQMCLQSLRLHVGHSWSQTLSPSLCNVRAAPWVLVVIKQGLGHERTLNIIEGGRGPPAIRGLGPGHCVESPAEEGGPSSQWGSLG